MSQTSEQPLPLDAFDQLSEKQSQTRPTSQASATGRYSVKGGHLGKLGLNPKRITHGATVKTKRKKRTNGKRLRSK